MSDCVDETAMAELIAEARQKAVQCNLTHVEMNVRLQDPVEFNKFVAETQSARLVTAGWEVLLSLRIFGDGEHHWHCSAMLWPQGRCLTTADAEHLDRIVQLSGAPEKLKPYQINADVHRPHHWVWREPAKADA